MPPFGQQPSPRCRRLDDRDPVFGSESQLLDEKSFSECHADFQRSIGPAKSVFEQDPPGDDAMQPLLGRAQVNGEGRPGGTAGLDRLTLCRVHTAHHQIIRARLFKMMCPQDGNLCQVIQRVEHFGVKPRLVKQSAIERHVAVSVHQ